MITWMQKHKKWLIVTIWISTIAFVGAGFVGWGSYDYGSSDGTVALVGDREVSVEEYQREYSSLYDNYSRGFGEQFNQEMADSLNLRDQAFQRTIQKNLFLSYGNSLGFNVNNEEIAKELVKMDAFILNGKFDKKTYVRVLNQNRTNPQTFEESIKRNILLKKVLNLFQVKASSNELNLLNTLLFAKDNLNISVFNIDDINFIANTKELEKYWKENKNNYMSLNAYTYEINTITLVKKDFTTEELKKYYDKYKNDFRKSDGKIKNSDEAKDDVILALSKKATKKLALKKYLTLKKNEIKFLKKETLFANELVFSKENNTKIMNATLGKILKPFFDNNSYTTIKVIEKLKPKTLSFTKALNKLRSDYEQEIKMNILNKLAKDELKNFKGKNIGDVSQSSTQKIEGLNQEETREFLKQLFSSSIKKGRISLANKIIVYKINSSKLAAFDITKEKEIESRLNNLLQEEVIGNLVKSLESTYKVKTLINTRDNN